MSPSLTALLQLASPTLPVGAYSYSQGLESAIDARLVTDEASTQRWIADGLRCVLARYEAPLWLRLHRACSTREHDALRHWNEDFLATRETAELHAETVQMGYSLAQLMRTLHADEPAPAHAPRYRQDAEAAAPRAGHASASDAHLMPAFAEMTGGIDGPVAYPTAHACACMAWGISADEGLVAYLYGWAENQAMAALKTVPLGQSAGQRILLSLRPVIAAAAQLAQALQDDELSTQTPLLAILSSQHQNQYSRLFRS